MSSPTPIPINSLPEELLTLVFRFVTTPQCDARKLYHVCLTCQTWYRIASKIIVSSLGNGNIRSCLRHLLNYPALRLSVSHVDAMLNLRPGGDVRIYGPGGSDAHSLAKQLCDEDLSRLRAEVLGLPEDVRNEYSFQKSRLLTTSPTHEQSRSGTEGENDEEDLTTRIQTRLVKKLRREEKLQKRMAVQKMVSEICRSSTDAVFTMILHWAVNLESLEISGDMSERSGSTLRLVKQAADDWLVATRVKDARIQSGNVLRGGGRTPLDNLRSVTLLRIRGMFVGPFFFLPRIRNIHLIGIDLDDWAWTGNSRSSGSSLKGPSPVKQLFLENISYEVTSLLSVVQLCERLESLLICLTDGTTTTADKAAVLADCIQAQRDSLVEIGIVDDRRYLPGTDEEEETLVGAEAQGQNNGQNNEDGEGEEHDNSDSDPLTFHYDSDDEQMQLPSESPGNEDDQVITQADPSGLHGFGLFEPPPPNLFPASTKIALRTAILDCASQLKRFTLQLRGSDTLSWSNDDGCGNVAEMRDILDKLVVCDEV